MNLKTCLTLSFLCGALSLPGQQVSEPEEKPRRLSDDFPRGQVSDPEEKPRRVGEDDPKKQVDEAEEKPARLQKPRIMNRPAVEIRRAELSPHQKALVERFEQLPEEEQTKVLYQISQVEDPEQLQELEEEVGEPPSAAEVFPPSSTAVRLTLQFNDGQTRSVFLKMEEWNRMATALNRYYKSGDPRGVLVETFRGPNEDASFIYAVAFPAVQQIHRQPLSRRRICRGTCRGSLSASSGPHRDGTAACPPCTLRRSPPRQHSTPSGSFPRASASGRARIRENSTPRCSSLLG